MLLLSRLLLFPSSLLLPCSWNSVTKIWLNVSKISDENLMRDYLSFFRRMETCYRSKIVSTLSLALFVLLTPILLLFPLLLLLPCYWNSVTEIWLNVSKILGENLMRDYLIIKLIFQGWLPIVLWDVALGSWLMALGSQHLAFGLLLFWLLAFALGL